MGDYILGKIGCGDTGKVKLARHANSAEKVCLLFSFPCPSSTYRLSQFVIEALPRIVSDPIPSETGELNLQDTSKEARTLREAALFVFLRNLYICDLRGMIIHHHHYIIFEYVDGGQMLDYIIGRDRLRARKAWRFARKLGSTLGRCHKNNVVHRHLTAENILISQTKITDFAF